MTRFVSVSSEDGDLLINPDWVRMLRKVGADGARTQIVFDEDHIVYVNVEPEEVAARFTVTD